MSSTPFALSSYVHVAAGEVASVTDPLGRVTADTYDALGRTVKTVADYTNGTPTASSNQTTTYAYDGVGNVLNMTAVMPAGQTSQTTAYVYGVTTGQGGAINDNDLLARVQYPDPTTGTNQSSGGTYNQSEGYTYDALGEKLTYTDRDGTVHAYTYDSMGRVTTDAVTAFGAGVDQTVASLGYTFNDAGLAASTTSYNASGGVVNQTAETYDGFGQLASESQATTGAVSTGTTPSVGYTHDAANGDRPTGLVYPNGRTVSYNYGAAGSLTSAASQIVSIGDSSGAIQSYSYLGLSTPVTFADGNGVTLSYLSTTGSTGDAGDSVTGLDRFGRVADQNWTGPFQGVGPAPRPTLDEQQYAYDANSNVLSRRNTVTPGQSELYGYDGLSRLTSFARGTLNAAGTAATGTAGTTESWALDALGNWNGNTVNGTTTSRTNSAQNQISSVTTPAAGGGTGTTTNLSYDANGDTTRDQTGQQYVYDGWNRLVAVKNATGTTIAAFTYDAQGRRVTETESGGTTSLYYTDAWQLIETRQNNTPTAQYVRSPFYVDGIVERDDMPVTANGTTTLTRRLYAGQDSDYNVTSLTDSSGSVVERYAYDPYGAVTVENVDGSVRGTGTTAGTAAASNFIWTILHQGLKLDVKTWTYEDRNRVYLVILGRFGQEDPGGFVNGPNTYQYVTGDPVNYIDPTGESAALIGGLVGGALGGLSDIIDQAGNGQPFNWAEFGGSVSGGAFAGFMTGAVGDVSAGGVGLIEIGVARLIVGANGLIIQKAIVNAFKNPPRPLWGGGAVKIRLWNPVQPPATQPAASDYKKGNPTAPLMFKGDPPGPNRVMIFSPEATVHAPFPKGHWPIPDAKYLTPCPEGYQLLDPRDPTGSPGAWATMPDGGYGFIPAYTRTVTPTQPGLKLQGHAEQDVKGRPWTQFDPS